MVVEVVMVLLMVVTVLLMVVTVVRVLLMVHINSHFLLDHDSREPRDSLYKASRSTEMLAGKRSRHQTAITSYYNLSLSLSQFPVLPAREMFYFLRS